MSNNPMHLDANETAFFKRQTEFISGKTYDKKFENLKAKMFIPVSTEIPSGSEFWTWRSFTKQGLAKIINDYGKDFPRVDIYGNENTVKVFSMGDSYGWSVMEIRRAMKAGINLSNRKAEAAKRGIEELQEKLAWDGDANYNIQGFVNYPGINTATLGTSAGSGDDTWPNKTPDEIIADLTALQNAVSVTTKGVEEINQILLPRARYNLIKNTRMTDGNDKSILTYFLSNNPGVSIDPLDRLSTAGAGGVMRALAYVRDPDHLVQQIPTMFEQFEADKQGMEYVVPCHSEFAGVTVFYPLSVAKMDGI